MSHDKCLECFSFNVKKNNVIVIINYFFVFIISLGGINVVLEYFNFNVRRNNIIVVIGYFFVFMICVI